jgi:hypothetical protein
LISSVKANTPAPVAPVAVAVKSATLVLVLALLLEEPDEPVEYCRGDNRWNLVCLKSCERQLAHVHGALLARRPKEAKERGFILVATRVALELVVRKLCTDTRIGGKYYSNKSATIVSTAKWPRHHKSV